MREIKFRGKTNEPVGDKKIWIFGDLLQPTMIDNIYEIADCESMDGSRYDVIPETVGQYTGLKDKNGKEIYEGDIVRDMEVYLTHQSYVKQEIESVQEAEKYRYFGNVAVVEFCTQEIASCGCCYQEFVGTGFKAKKVDLTCCEVIRKYI